MMLWGLAGSCVFYVLLTAFTAETARHPSLSYGTIVSIYLFGICFAWGFTPLQTLYAVECLGNRTRAKGSGLNYLFLNVAIIVNTFGISVGIQVIGWRLYGSLPPTTPPLSRIRIPLFQASSEESWLTLLYIVRSIPSPDTPYRTLSRSFLFLFMFFIYFFPTPHLLAEKEKKRRPLSCIAYRQATNC